MKFRAFLDQLGSDMHLKTDISINENKNLRGGQLLLSFESLKFVLVHNVLS